MVDAKTAAKRILQAFAIPLIVLALIGLARCTTTSAHSKELGTTSYTENPFTYAVGKVYAVGYVDDSITLRVQPLATYGLFTEDILICDWKNAAGLFQGKRNPLILTYKVRASRSVQGIGCHELVRVDEMRDTLPLGD